MALAEADLLLEAADGVKNLPLISVIKGGGVGDTNSSLRTNVVSPLRGGVMIGVRLEVQASSVGAS